MLRHVLAATFFFTGLVTSLDAVERAPQMAAVKSVEAEVRSGPGEAFFATDRLINGTRVEIYRRTASGWCAIRPPDGSFSYVRADQVQRTQQPNVLAVKADGAKTRVGSKLSRTINVEYITLRAGEPLHQLSGPVRIGASGQTWYRIAPPAGEFRWMRLRDLAPLDPPAALASHSTSSEPRPRRATKPQPLKSVPPVASPAAGVPASPTPTPATHAVEPDDDGMVSIMVRPTTPAADPDPQANAAAGDLNEVHDSAQPVASPPALPSRMETEPIPKARTPELHPIQPTAYMPAEMTDETTSLEPIAQADWELAADASEEPESTRVTSAADELMDEPIEQVGWAEEEWVVEGSSAADGLDLADQLVELDLALSRTVTQDITAWDLQPILAEAARMARAAADPQIVHEATRLWTRTREFAELQQRHRALLEAEAADSISLANAVTGVDVIAGLAPPLMQSPPLPPTPVPQRDMPQRVTPQRSFAGAGWLVPVVSGRGDLPRHALTDSQGNFLTFVSPQPGLNLRRYERREVGIVGKSLLPGASRTPQLIAERVVVLDRHR